MKKDNIKLMHEDTDLEETDTEQSQSAGDPNESTESPVQEYFDSLDDAEKDELVNIVMDYKMNKDDKEMVDVKDMMKDDNND